MELKDLQMHPAPISDMIFLGKIKSDIYVKKIDFTEQFYFCLAELCIKKLNEGEDSISFSAETIDGRVVEINAFIKKDTIDNQK